MAQINYRGNLSAKVFPFVSEYFGQTVIIPGPDQNFSRQLTSAEDLDKDRGIPQVYYLHNVMPCAEGFQSIGFKSVIADTKVNFINQFTLQDSTGNEIFYSHTSDGLNYVLPFDGIHWVQINTIAGTAGVAVSTATINGQTYIYFSKVGCYMYDTGTNTLIPITLTGLDETAVLGITASAGYMIAWTSTAVAWSSTVEHAIPTDPIDFVPSLSTGAGGGSVETAKGKLTICVPHYLGFIIFTPNNAIAAVYSGNARFPFNFREVVNCGGLANSSLISVDSGSGSHYAYTTSGLQLVSVSNAQTIFPEVTDFIAGKYFEDFDEIALSLTHQVLTSPMKKAINVVSDRYLVISYGIAELTHALVFDLVEKRFGKLRHTHVNCFEWKQLSPDILVETPRQSIGFLAANGSIATVDFSYTSDNSAGVMLLGKYQLSRLRMMTLEQVTLENIKAGNTFNFYAAASFDGKNLQPPTEGYLAVNNGALRSYNFHQTGVNHTLIAKGSFYCSSIELRFHINGRV